MAIWVEEYEVNQYMAYIFFLRFKHVSLCNQNHSYLNEVLSFSTSTSCDIDHG